MLPSGRIEVRQLVFRWVADHLHMITSRGHNAVHTSDFLYVQSSFVPPMLNQTIYVYIAQAS